MMVPPFRSAMFALLTIWPVLAHAAPAAHAVSANPAAVAPDVDTTNGVAPTLPGAAAGAPAPAPQPIAVPVSPAPSAADAAQKYCQNIAVAAADARAAWQSKKLASVEGEVNDRIKALEARTADLKDVLARRDEALKRADAALVAIYGKMKPDTAAEQLSALDDELAAAVLSQLNPRAASAILNEVTPARAAKLVNTIAGTPDPEGKKL